MNAHAKVHAEKLAKSQDPHSLLSDMLDKVINFEMNQNDFLDAVAENLEVFQDCRKDISDLQDHTDNAVALVTDLSEEINSSIEKLEAVMENFPEETKNEVLNIRDELYDQTRGCVKKATKIGDEAYILYTNRL